MPTVTPNLNASTLTRGRDGHRYRRVYLVHWESVEQPADPLAAALGVSGVPPHGTADPVIAGIFALDFEVSLAEESRADVLVAVTFRRPETNTQDQPTGGGPTPSVRQVGARVQPATRTQDALGNPIVTTHAELRTAGGVTIQDDTVTQPAEVEVQVPTMVLQVERTVSTSPVSDAKDFVGHINSDLFEGETARKWLCTAIEGTSDDEGATWRVSYEFEFRDETWDASVVYIDPETGRPPSTVTAGQELRTYRVYPQRAFGALGL